MSKAKGKAKKITEEDLPELKQYRLGQRIVSVIIGVGLTSVAIANTVIYALRGKPDKAISNARKALKSFVRVVDPNAKADKKKGEGIEVSLSRRLLRIFGDVAVLGLSSANTVFKALRGDIIGVFSDLGGIVTMGAEIAYGIMPFFGSKVEREESRFDRFIAPITKAINNTIDLTKSITENIIKRMDKSPPGRAMLRIGKAAYDIATSKYVKVALQVVTAVMALATATTPVGWAAAAVAFVAIGGSAIKSLLHARSLRLLNEKKDCLISLQKEKAEQLRLLNQNFALQKLQSQGREVDSQGLLGEKPIRPPINVKREVLSALGSSIFGGAAAILEVSSADPAKQVATGFILLGGVSKEVNDNIKKEISRLDLKEEIWMLGGSDKSLDQVQAELLESKKRTMALTLLAADIAQTKSQENIQDRFEHFMQKTGEVLKKPTFGDRMKSGLKGFVKDCNTLILGDIRKGWRELMGKQEENLKASKIPETLTADSLLTASSLAKEVVVEKSVDALDARSYKSEAVAANSKNNAKKEARRGGRVENIVKQIEAKQKTDTVQKETGVARPVAAQTKVKMRVKALEKAAQEVVHNSARNVATAARGHVVNDTHSKASRNSKKSPKAGKIRAA